MKYYENIYKYGKILFYVLYFLAFFGLWDKAPIYFKDVDYFFKLFLAIILIILFNPLNNTTEFTKMHRNIVFSSGVFLLTTTTLNAFKTNSKLAYDHLKYLFTDVF